MAEEIIDQQSQQNVQDPIPKEKLWKALSDGKYYTKSYDEFSKQYSTPESISKLHGALNKGGFYTKSSDDFNNQYFNDVKKKGSTQDSANGVQTSTEPLQTSQAPTNIAGDSYSYDNANTFKSAYDPTKPIPVKTKDGVAEFNLQDVNVTGKLNQNKLQADSDRLKELSGVYQNAQGIDPSQVAAHRPQDTLRQGADESYLNIPSQIINTAGKDLSELTSTTANVLRNTNLVNPGLPSIAPALYDENGNKTEYAKKVGWSDDFLAKVSLGADGIADDFKELVHYRKLPNTFMGRGLTSLAQMTPDLLLAGATGGESEILNAGKLLTEKTGGELLSKLALNPFAKIMGVKGFSTGYNDAIRSGKDPNEALLSGAEQGGHGYVEGVKMDALGFAAGKFGKGIEDILQGSGLTNSSGFLTRTGSNVAGNVLAFGMEPFAKGDQQGMENSLFLGLAFGAIHGNNDAKQNEQLDAQIKQINPNLSVKDAPEILADAAQSSRVNTFYNSTPEAIKEVMNNKMSADELNANALEYGKKALEATDPESKKQFVDVSSAFRKASEIKQSTESILKDKGSWNNFIDGNNQLTDQEKANFNQKVDGVYRAYDPTEQQKTSLGNDILQHQQEAQIHTENAKNAADPVAQTESEVMAKQASDLADGKKKELTSIVEQQLKPKEEVAPLEQPKTENDTTTPKIEETPVSEATTPIETKNQEVIKPVDEVKPIQNEVQQPIPKIEDVQKNEVPKTEEVVKPDEKVEKPTEEVKKPFVTKSGKQNIAFENGELKITDSKTGEEVSAPTKRKAIREYVEQKDFSEGERSKEVPDGLQENEYNNHVVETSNNPAELAEVFVNEKPEAPTLSYKEQILADEGISNLDRNSYTSEGDRNNINQSKAKSYFSDAKIERPDRTKENAGNKKVQIDDLAERLSEQYGAEFTKQDVIDFIDKFPNGAKTALKLGETNTAQGARNKFHELTGLDLTQEVAERAILQAKEKLNKQEQEFINKDYESREQFEREYWEQHAKTDGFTKDSITPKTEISETKKEEVSASKDIKNTAEALKNKEDDIEFITRKENNRRKSSFYEKSKNTLFKGMGGNASILHDKFGSKFKYFTENPEYAKAFSLSSENLNQIGNVEKYNSNYEKKIEFSEQEYNDNVLSNSKKSNKNDLTTKDFDLYNEKLSKDGYDAIVIDRVEPLIPTESFKGHSADLRNVNVKEHIILNNDALLKVAENPKNIKQTAEGLAGEYHKAKQEGNSPELIKAVEDLLGNNKEFKTETTKAEVKPKPVAELSQKEIDAEIAELEALLNSGKLDKLEPVKGGNYFKGDKVAEYVSKVTPLLKNLFPDVNLNFYNTTAEYTKATGRSELSAGVYDRESKSISLNLELIKDRDASSTVLHEAIHPIVDAVFLKNQKSLSNAVGAINKLVGEKGFEELANHVDLYKDRGAEVQSIEYVTEFLAKTLDGAIDYSKLTKSNFTKAKELINALLAKVGIKYKIETASDIVKLTESLGKAFGGDYKALSDAIGTKSEKGKGSLDNLLNDRDAIMKRLEELRKAKVEVEPKVESVKAEPQGKKVSEAFEKLANRSLETNEIKETESNVESVTGDMLDLGDKQFSASTFENSIPMGIEVVESAKAEFGETYVTDLLNYLNANKNTMSLEKRVLITLSLENNLRKEALGGKTDLLNKQIKLVTKAGMELLRDGAKANALGRIRHMIEVGYDNSKITDQLFSAKEKKQRNEIIDAVEATPHDIQKEAEAQEQAKVDADIAENAKIEEAINKGVESQINEIYKKLPTERRKRADEAIKAIEKFQKKLRSKTYDAGIGLPIAILDAGLSTIKNAIKAGVNIADAIELGIAKIKEKHGKWDKENEFREDMLDGFKSEGVGVKEKASTEDSRIKTQVTRLTKEVADLDKQIANGEKTPKEGEKPVLTNAQIERLKAEKKAKLDILNELDPDAKESVKKGLIEAGFGKETTVTVNKKDANGNDVLDADGNKIKVKEKRQVLDWVKLAGEEGSPDNIAKHVETYLKNKGYSGAEILRMQEALKEQYVKLQESIIEKSINRLDNQNQKSKDPSGKSNARKLAELYNDKLFDQKREEYERLLNKALGLSEISQKAFDEARELSKSYATLLASKDANGNTMSEISLRKFINDLHKQQEELLTKAVNKDVARTIINPSDAKSKEEYAGKVAYIIAKAVREFASLGQRAILGNLNALENVTSGYVNRGVQNFGDFVTRNKITTPELKKQWRKAAQNQFMDIVFHGGDDFGHQKSIFISKSEALDWLGSLSDNQLYNVGMALMGQKAYLEAADSMHKIAINERLLVDASIRVMSAKNIKKSEALKTISKQLTGKSFEEAEIQTKQIIDKVNTEAGRKVLRDNKEAVYLATMDVVKQNLIRDGILTERELKAVANGTFKSAGEGMGHVANNPLSEGLGKLNSMVKDNLHNAIKEKDYLSASYYILQSAGMNLAQPFVGGGTNWQVLTLDYTGVSSLWSVPVFLKDVMSSHNKLDLGGTQNELTKQIYEKQAKRAHAIRSLSGLVFSSGVMLSYFMMQSNDEKKKPYLQQYWNLQKKYPVFKRVSNKVTPTMLMGLMAYSNGDQDDIEKVLTNSFGVKSIDWYSDGKKAIAVGKIISSDKQSEIDAGLGAAGQLTFGKISAPLVSWKMAKDFYNIGVDLGYNKPLDADYKVSGYWNGAFQGGFIEAIGLRPAPKVSMYDVKTGKEANITGKEKLTYEAMTKLITNEILESKKADLSKLTAPDKEKEIKKYITKAGKEALEVMSGYNEGQKDFSDNGTKYVIDGDNLKLSVKLYKEYANQFSEKYDKELSKARKTEDSESSAAILARKNFKKLINEKVKDELLKRAKYDEIKLKVKE